MGQKGERMLLIVQAEGRGPPLPTRLKRVLKGLLRSHGCRCVWVQDATGWRFGDGVEQGEALDLSACVITVPAECKG